MSTNNKSREDESRHSSSCPPKGTPQGEEGNPNQCIKSSESLEDTELDRRPYDLDKETPNDSDEKASRIPGIQSDLKNNSSDDAKPDGQAK